jgi:hypothetical protein
MPVSNSEIWGRFCDGLDSTIVVQHSVRPIITLHGRITAREYVDRLGNQVHPMMGRYFRTTMQFSKTMSSFTRLELISHGLKIMKVNFNMFPGQHNYQILTTLNHSGQLWRLE